MRAIEGMKLAAAEMGALAVGAMALGAFAIGAIAIGRLAIGGLAVRNDGDIYLGLDRGQNIAPDGRGSVLVRSVSCGRESVASLARAQRASRVPEGLPDRAALNRACKYLGVFESWLEYRGVRYAGARGLPRIFEIT